MVSIGFDQVEYKVVADERGKKMSLVCLISYSPATKSSSTRPQQVLKLVPRVSDESGRIRRIRDRIVADPRIGSDRIGSTRFAAGRRIHADHNSARP
ncbi:hypothetical protein Taro_022189 [Colocasia esculenta]|uniref:Uncharacterized protein n=1 Tax=Colocasia esculenta TaxID=4460 RepID=A0A843V779_COLES|nr:hypothetical protein [Colocasia esculenta]